MTSRTCGLLGLLSLAWILALAGCAEEKKNRELARGEKRAAKEDMSPAAEAAKARRVAEVLREAGRLRRRAEGDLSKAKRLREEHRLSDVRRNARVLPTLPRPGGSRSGRPGMGHLAGVKSALSSKQEAEVYRQVRGRVGGLRGCYLRTLITSPPLSNRAKVSFFIETTGKVSGVSVETDLPEAARVCLSKSIAKWTLSPVPGRTPYGPIRLHFTPGSQYR